jgi:uncharacterized protein YbcI
VCQERLRRGREADGSPLNDRTVAHALRGARTGPTSDNSTPERRPKLPEPESEPSRGPEDPSPPRGRQAPPTSAEVADEIRRDILAIQNDSYGRSANDARAYVLEDFVVVVLEDLELLPNEEFMVANGHADAVIRVRQEFQRAIESTFRAAVERSTGRRVVSFASQISIEEPRFAVEIFRLAPE